MVKHIRNPSARRNPEQGAVLGLVALMLVILLGTIGLVVDLGYAFTVRNQLQNVADASALAGARLLGSMYQQLTPAEQSVFHCDEDCVSEIRDTVQVVAGHNRAGGLLMSLVPTEIRIGQWDGTTDTFTETLDVPDAVDVVARRDDIRNGPIATFFFRALRIESAPISTLATAALTGQGSVEEGDLQLPVTLSDWFFQPGNFCNDHIRFNPTNDPTSCGGWTTYFLGANDPMLEDILNEEVDSPELIANQSIINMNGGNIVAAFPDLLMLFQRHGCATTAGAAPEDREYLTSGDDTCIDWMEVQSHPYRVPWMELNNQGVEVPTYYPDPLHPNQDDLSAPRFYHMWETSVPVYSRDDCTNPNQSEMVLGFTTVIITDVNQSTQQIDGVVVCDRVSPEDNRGGGGEYGTKGSIPGLVR